MDMKQEQRPLAGIVLVSIKKAASKREDHPPPPSSRLAAGSGELC